MSGASPSPVGAGSRSGGGNGGHVKMALCLIYTILLRVICTRPAGNAGGPGKPQFSDFQDQFAACSKDAFDRLNPRRGASDPCKVSTKSPSSHGGNTGSYPVWDANIINKLRTSTTICVPVVFRRRARLMRSSAARGVSCPRGSPNCACPFPAPRGRAQLLSV